MSTADELRRAHAESDTHARQEAIRAMMAHRQTRKFLWWLLQIGKAIGHNPFTTEPLTMANECGQMLVGQYILAELTSADPEYLIQLMRENHDEREQRDAELRDAAADDAPGWGSGGRGFGEGE